MLTRMTEQDWALALDVFDAAQSSRGKPGHDDRRFLEAILYFTVHNITWRALPAEYGKWKESIRNRGVLHAATALSAAALSLASPGYQRSNRNRSVPSRVRVRVCSSR